MNGWWWHNDEAVFEGNVVESEHTDGLRNTRMIEKEEETTTTQKDWNIQWERLQETDYYLKRE